MTNPLFYLSDLGADRLKALRDGVADYVYYTLLEKLANEKKDVEAKIILENVKTLVFISIVCMGGMNVRTYASRTRTPHLLA